MDILANQGETSATDLAEMAAMEKDELVALVTRLNRGWYQLLERLEDAHRLDLKKHEEHWAARLSEVLSTMRMQEAAQLDGWRRELATSGKELNELEKALRENGKKYDSLKSVLEKLTSASSADR